MCIVNGGVKVTLKGKGRMKKLNRYECQNKKCGKLWSLQSTITISGRRISTGNRQNPYRREGHCNCGTRFDVPFNYVSGDE